MVRPRIESANCIICGTAVDPQRAFREIRGFEEPRSQGGANKIVRRRETGKFACRGCIIRQQMNIHPDQTSFVDTPPKEPSRD